MTIRNYHNFNKLKQWHKIVIEVYLQEHSHFSGNMF